MTTYALLQSPVEFQLNKKPSPSSPNAQRPKLSLNTTTQCSYGRSSTGLRLDSLSEASPTIQNTYRNTYQPQCESWHEAHSGTATSSNGTCATEARVDVPAYGRYTSQLDEPIREDIQKCTQAPYALPSDVSSILINSPLAKRYRSSSVRSTSAQQVPSGRKSSKPRQKRVCFCDPLSEEITTATYVFKHSDIRSRSSSPASRAGRSRKSNIRGTSRGSPPPLKSRKSDSEAPKSSSSTPEEDGTSASTIEDNEEDVRCPKTPVAGRHKKERQWVWTLGPLPRANGPGSITQMENSSEEDLEQSLGESVTAASAFSS